MVFKFALKTLFLSFCLGGLALSASASTLLPDFNRMAPLNSVALQTGDFDGDGRPDELYLTAEHETGRVAVHIRLNKVTGSEDIRVTSLDAGDNRIPELRVVSAGKYSADCGTYSSACSKQKIVAEYDSLVFAAGGETKVLLHWSGDHFEQDFVRGDDAFMAIAISSLYAVNP